MFIRYVFRSHFWLKLWAGGPMQRQKVMYIDVLAAMVVEFAKEGLVPDAHDKDQFARYYKNEPDTLQRANQFLADCEARSQQVRLQKGWTSTAFTELE